jgi:acyl-CoA synthetase (NDP forming)
VGNEATASIGDFGQILLNDPDTDGFLLFLETIRDPSSLATFARRAAAQGKLVTAYRIGRSEEGQALSVSHTGALTGSSKAASAFLRDIGKIGANNRQMPLSCKGLVLQVIGCCDPATFHGTSMLVDKNPTNIFNTIGYVN